MTSITVLLVCIRFRWDAASDSSAANCQTLTRWPASAGGHLNPGGFFSKAAPGCCPQDTKPCCWHGLLLHTPCLWDLAPEPLFTLQVAWTSVPHLPQAWQLWHFSWSAHLSAAGGGPCMWGGDLCRQLCPLEYKLHRGSPLKCTSCFPQTWCFVGFWPCQRSGMAWTNVTKARKVLLFCCGFFFSSPPGTLQYVCYSNVRVSWTQKDRIEYNYKLSQKI